MSQPVIRVEGLSKKFCIGARYEPYQTLREALVRSATAPLRRAAAVLRGRATDSSEDEIWALRDVSFTVERGEVLGTHWSQLAPGPNPKLARQALTAERKLVRQYGQAILNQCLEACSR